jgi:hypothetical protein
MQSALDAGTENDTNLVTAEVLREMTITKEALFERQKQGVLDSFMSSMVRQASENGNRSFSATLAPQFDTTLLTSIVDTLKGLGYTVTTEAKSDEKLGAFILVVVSW